MNNSVKKIVITGGPCAGKTMALTYVKAHFERNGFFVIVVEEVPTELMRMGITLDRFGKIPFQKAIIDLQQKKEQVVLDVIGSSNKNDKIIILYDRGILDHYIYINAEQQRWIECELGLEQNQLYYNYDIVIHLVSTATEMPHLYEKTENRHEDVIEARDRDAQIEEIWHLHPRYLKIGCELHFDEKINKLIKEIEEGLEQK